MLVQKSKQDIFPKASCDENSFGNLKSLESSSLSDDNTYNNISAVDNEKQSISISLK